MRGLVGADLSLRCPKARSRMEGRHDRDGATSVHGRVRPITAAMYHAVFLRGFSYSTRRSQTRSNSSPDVPRRVIMFTVITRRLSPRRAKRTNVRARVDRFICPRSFSSLREEQFGRERVSRRYSGHRKSQVFLRMVRRRCCSVRCVRGVFHAHSVPTTGTSVSSFML